MQRSTNMAHSVMKVSRVDDGRDTFLGTARAKRGWVAATAAVPRKGDGRKTNGAQQTPCR